MNGNARECGETFMHNEELYKIVGTKLIEDKNGECEVRIHAKGVGHNKELKFNIPA